MKIYNNILETIGNTPMVKMNQMIEDMGVSATVLAKVETTNPGNSIKDRMAVKMIEDAEKAGLLKPGGTIIEGTSGNTGMGLAIAAVLKGYKCIFTTTDKQSKEKVDALKAFGAEVIVCPTDVDPEDPRSYYSVSSRLVDEVPNSWKPDQYNNLSNRTAHYESTGPEIWDQTDGTITHLVVGVGTGGTISGTAKFLKEKNPNIQVLGIDTYGSIFKKYLETGSYEKSDIYPYITEGIGEDFVPENVDFSLIDHFEKVTDKDAAIYTSLIPKKEGIFVGNSAGAAMAGIAQMKERFKKDDVIVVIFHDHGTRYLGKMFNEEWMRERGFVESKPMKKAIDLIEGHQNLPLLSVKDSDSLSEVVDIFKKYSVSQIPVSDKDRNWVGSVSDSDVYAMVLENTEILSDPVKQHMNDPFPMVSYMDDISKIAKLINKNNPAVLMNDMGGNTHIITKFDIISALG
jgi:cystathionine beta-synthase